MGSLHKKIYTLMTFLMVLSAIFLSMLMILLSTQNEIKHLICGLIYSWRWNWIWSTRHCGLKRKWHVDFNDEKTQFISFDKSINTGGIDVKINASVPDENHLLIWWVLCFSSKLDCGSCKLPPRKLRKLSLDLFYKVSFCWGCPVSL